MTPLVIGVLFNFRLIILKFTKPWVLPVLTFAFLFAVPVLSGLRMGLLLLKLLTLKNRRVGLRKFC